MIANARRLEVFDNQGVSEAERAGGEGDWQMAEANLPTSNSRTYRRDHHGPPDDASVMSDGSAASRARKAVSGQRVFGVSLHDLLRDEVSSVPRVVQECTRHMLSVSGGVADAAALTAEGDASAVLGVRNAFERGADAGQGALLELMDGRSDADVRVACSVLRAYLLELPQPVVPTELYLPLLEAARARDATGTRAGAPSKARTRLEAVLAPMPAEHWALLEHVLAFLGAMMPSSGQGGRRYRVARVWAPCILRAPARIMSQFQGKVIDAMADALLILLNMPVDADGDAGDDHASVGGAQTVAAQAGPPTADLLSLGDGSDNGDGDGGGLEADGYSEEDGEPRDGMATPPSPGGRQRDALMSSLDALSGAASPSRGSPGRRAGAAAEPHLIDLDDGPPPPPPPPPRPVDAVAQLQQQRESADELLSALRELRDDCSILDDATIVSEAMETADERMLALEGVFPSPSPAAAASPARAATGSGEGLTRVGARERRRVHRRHLWRAHRFRRPRSTLRCRWRRRARSPRPFRTRVLHQWTRSPPAPPSMPPLSHAAEYLLLKPKRKLRRARPTTPQRCPWSRCRLAT